MSEDLKYWMWLSSLSGIIPYKRIQLLKFFGGAKQIWDASQAQLLEAPFMTSKIYEQILNDTLRNQVQSKMEELYLNNIKILTINDPLYPVLLKKTYDPPVVLFYKGRIKPKQRCIAIVGSRKATAYGLSTAQKLSYDLSKTGLCIVSGMARGIDSVAHKGALKANGNTYAILGCGVDIVYPSECRRLMKEIADYGAVISEYPPGTLPKPYNFPARNRIISGISDGVVVIEAGAKSGTLITANFALEQGREVFAVPGNINNINSMGTNRLISEGAKLVTSVDDIMDEIKMFENCHDKNFNEYKNSKSQRKKQLNHEDLDDEEIKVVSCLLTEPLNIDIISKKCGLSMSTVNSILMILEIKGVVEQFPGKIFALNARK